MRLFHHDQPDAAPHFESCRRGQLSLCTAEVALYGAARDVLPEIEGLVRQADTSNAPGYTQLFSDVLLLLLRREQSWKGVSLGSQPVDENGASATFNRAVLDARSRVRHEELSNTQGVLRSDIAPPAGAALDMEDESGGLTVTCISVSDQALKAPTVLSSETFAAALRLLASLPPQQLLAMELVWMPHAGEPLISGDDLLRLFPNLQDV